MEECRLLFNRVLSYGLYCYAVLYLSQVVHSDLFLYVEGSCLMFQHKNVKEIEKALNNDFENICDWFVDSKLSFHFDKDKIIVIRNRKPSQRKIKIIKRLNKTYK